MFLSSIIECIFLSCIKLQLPQTQTHFMLSIGCCLNQVFQEKYFCQKMSNQEIRYLNRLICWIKKWVMAQFVIMMTFRLMIVSSSINVSFAPSIPQTRGSGDIGWTKNKYLAFLSCMNKKSYVDIKLIKVVVSKNKQGLYRFRDYRCN